MNCIKILTLPFLPKKISIRELINYLQLIFNLLERKFLKNNYL